MFVLLVLSEINFFNVCLVLVLFCSILYVVVMCDYL